MANANSYTYRAVDATGARREGELVSVSRLAALESLSRQGLVPLELHERASVAATANSTRPIAPGGGVAAVWTFRRSSGVASRRELLALTQSLAALLKAGLTIDRVLQISLSLAPRSNARTLTEKLLQQVRSGKTLSEAFASAGQRLPAYYVSMVNAGESGGSLPVTLERLAELMRRQAEIRERIQSALVYPSLLAGVVLITLVILLTFVLPRFETLFSESEAPLPFSTRAVLASGRFLSDYWWAITGAALALVSGLTLWLRTLAGRAAFDAWTIRSRLTLGLPAATSAARLLRTLSTLCANGTPLPAALRVARGTVGNLALLAAIGRVANAVQAGESFSSSLAHAKLFPPVAAQLARVGEETGTLDEMLLSAATVLEEESQLRIERLLSLFVPLITVAMGVVVAGLIGSVLIGLLSINDLAF
jgi:general secretion pathway protein F